MNNNLNKPSHIASLATSCILVHTDVKVWTATKQDQASTNEVTTAKKASPNAARVTQHLLAGNEKHKAILNKRQMIYNGEKLLTYPWAGNTKLLPVADLPKFMKWFEENKTEFNKLVDDFYADYSNIISTMAFKMGDFFKRSNYPSVQEIQEKFAIKLYTSEVPQGDFRVQISQELADDLHHNYERQATDLVNEVVLKQQENLIAVMESISNACMVEEQLDLAGNLKIKRKKIYDSTIQRALDLCNTYQDFNLTNNPVLEQARARLQGLLTGINIDALRDSDSMRTHVKGDVDGILKLFGK